MALVTWGFGNDIISQFDRMQREMNSLLSGYRRASPWNAEQGSSVYPALNVYDTGEGYVVRAEIPGVDQKNLDIQVAGETLSIKGERKPPEEHGGLSYHRRERDYGQFHRSLTLPKAVDSSKTVASFVEGVLELQLPYAEEAKSRKITIKAS